MNYYLCFTMYNNTHDQIFSRSLLDFVEICYAVLYVLIWYDDVIVDHFCVIANHHVHQTDIAVNYLKRPLTALSLVLSVAKGRDAKFSEGMN